MNNLDKEKTDVVSVILDNTSSLGWALKIKCYLWKKIRRTYVNFTNGRRKKIPVDEPTVPSIPGPIQGPIKEPTKNPKIRVLNIQ